MADDLVDTMGPLLAEHLAAEPEHYDADRHRPEAAGHLERAWDEWDRLRGAYVAIISARLLRDWADRQGLDLWGKR